MKFFLLFVFPLLASAHPVIYQGGIALSHMSMRDLTDAQANYSFTSRWAAGGSYWRLENPQGQERELYLAKLNHLLFRHNGESSQANIYLHAGYGDGWLGGVEADWETRRYFVGIKELHLGQREFDTDIWVARLGYSPAEAPFEQLQTWVMLQAWHDRFSAAETKVGPLLRLFYHNVLWELGATFKGDLMLNLMVHL
jgi:hypothetical protein